MWKLAYRFDAASAGRVARQLAMADDHGQDALMAALLGVAATHKGEPA